MEASQNSEFSALHKRLQHSIDTSHQKTFQIIDLHHLDMERRRQNVVRACNCGLLLPNLVNPLCAMSSHTCSQHEHEIAEELGESHDAHDFMGHEYLLSEGTAHLCSFFQQGKSGPVRTLIGLYVPEDTSASMSVMGVDVTAITPRNCCLGPDTTVFLLKLTEAKVRMALYLPKTLPFTNSLALFVIYR